MPLGIRFCDFDIFFVTLYLLNISNLRYIFLNISFL